MDGSSFVDALAKRLSHLSLSRRQTFPLAAGLLAGRVTARPAAAQDRAVCSFLGDGCLTAENCCGGASDGAVCQPLSHAQRRPAGSAAPRKHGHHGHPGGHGHSPGGHNIGMCVCAAGFTPCQHATANCCGGPFPVCCRPHSSAFCCSADAPVCCDVGAAPLTCCTNDFSVCCNQGSSSACCSTEFPRCCPPGSAFDCCPDGTECSPDGCLSLTTATGERGVIRGAAGGGRRGRGGR